MSDLGQFQEPFAEVPLGPVEPEPEPDTGQDPADTAEPWWVDDDEDWP